MERLPFYLLLVTALFVGAVSGVRFTVPDDSGGDCLLMDARFSLTVEALIQQTDIRAVTMNDKMADSIVVTGSCVQALSTVRLSFPNSIIWSFIFRIKRDVVTMDLLVQFVPVKVFTSPAITVDYSLITDDPGTTQLSSPDQSFVCDKDIKSNYNYNKTLPDPVTYRVTSTLSDFQVQAFNVKNDTYSPSVNCQDDPVTIRTPETSPTTSTSTTATTTTTPTITTITPNPNPPNTYIVRNKDTKEICIELRGYLDFSVKYVANFGNGSKRTNTTRFSVPPDAYSHGRCHMQEDSQKLTITFFDSWRLDFIFRTDKNLTWAEIEGESPSEMGYKIRNITLTFFISRDRFPGAVLPDGRRVKAHVPTGATGLPHKAASTSYYSCKSSVDLSLTQGVVLNTSNLTFKAFNKNTDEGFAGYKSECSRDNSEDNRPFAIVMGSVVGGLLLLAVVAVVVAYIRQRRGRYNYERW